MQARTDASANTASAGAPKSSPSSRSDAPSAHSPFDNTKVKSYSHKANIVPPYVLDKLSQAHYKDQLNNTNVGTDPKRKDDDDYGNFANDLFIKSVNHNWHDFLHTIKQPLTYCPNDVTYEKDSSVVDKLEGGWGGEERLKLALLGTPSSDTDTYVTDSSSFMDKVFGVFKKKSKSRDDNPRVRSKAGYWMSDEKRADIIPFFKRLFVVNPLVPLLLRVCIILFSACALGLACTIFQYSKHRYGDGPVSQQPSTIMAIVVQCCAIAYLAYIAYDEYNGMPMGLRDPLGKMKLIMLDLLFIIFSAANLSLAFNTMLDEKWVCHAGKEATLTVTSICRRQRSLASFLLLVEILWVLTFTISIVRVVDRVSVSTSRAD